MDRISNDELFIRMAALVAGRGTCSRAKVGAVLVRDRRVISTGYNGAPAGQPHCTHVANEENGCSVAVHAELNAIAYAAKYGISTEGTTMYCTHSPCKACVWAIHAAGIEEVVYNKRYRLSEGLEMCHELGIEIRSYA